MRRSTGKKTFIKEIARLVFAVGAALSLLLRTGAAQVPEIAPAEFTRLVEELSGPGGYFYTDNWVTNELSYLEVIPDLKAHDITGGAYVGVGPEQNFAYIEAIRPEIAFVVDIRRQNTLQHLVYKILFELAESRTEWLSMLLSIPAGSGSRPGSEVGVQELMRYFAGRTGDPEMEERSAATVTGILHDSYGMRLSRRDSAAVAYIFRNFRYYGLNITYRGSRVEWYPSLREILLTAHNDSVRSPFDSAESYRYLRDMHKRNKIVPVTGDFAGETALPRIAAYLKERDIPVSAFYVSNVEEYLIREPSQWRAWERNVLVLPADENSVLIRWTHENGWQNHRTRLQRFSIFLDNCANGRYRTYDDLKLLDYIR